MITFQSKSLKRGNIPIDRQTNIATDEFLMNSGENESGIETRFRKPPTASIENESWQL